MRAVKLVYPSKALPPISTTESGITSELTSVEPRKASLPIVVRLLVEALPSEIAVMLVVPENALFSIWVSVSGKETVVIPVSSLNALSPMYFTV